MSVRLKARMDLPGVKGLVMGKLFVIKDWRERWALRWGNSDNDDDKATLCE